MGSYNQIMSAARAVQAHRRALRIDAPHAKDREEASFPFVCPECGEGSAVPAGCPRCDVEMRDVNKTVQLARHADVRDATTRDGTMAAFGVGVVIGVPLLLFLGALSMDAADLPGLGIPAFVWFLLAAVVLGGASSVRLHQQLAPILAGRRERARLRTLATDRAKRARRSRAATAKEHLLVSIPGHVHVEQGRLVVEDEGTRVRVPVCASLRVISDDGERHALSEGEEVVVVGVGAHRRGPGPCYRDTTGDFELDGAHPIDVWIR